MDRPISILALTLITLVLLVGIKAERAEPEAPPIETVAQLEARLLEILEQNKTPGMIGAIVSGDEVIWQGALGIADRSTNSSVTRDTLFRVGSISKSFISLSVLRLVERGELTLNLLVNESVPEAGIDNPWQATDPVRLYHVLEHTAGFDDIHFRDYSFSDPDVTSLQGVQFNNGSRRVRWRPGTRMSYANIGPPIVALVIEKTTGDIFETVVDKEVFIPLGMETATFFFDENVAASYSGDGETVQPYVHIPVRSSGALNATSADMIQLLKMYIGRGMISGDRFLQATSLDRMETPTSTLAAKQGFTAGYGLSNYLSQKNGFVMHGHNGGIDGFSSSYAYLSDHGIGFFYSINAASGKASRAVNDAIFEFATKGIEPSTPIQHVTVPKNEMEAFTGYYEPNSPRPELLRALASIAGVVHVNYLDGDLVVKPLFGTEEKYSPVGNNMFIKEGDALPSIMFVESVDGEILMQGGSTSIQISSVYVFSRMACVVFVLVMMLSALLFAPVWIIRKWLGKLTANNLTVRMLPLAATFMFVMSIVMLMIGVSSDSIAEVSLSSVGYFLGTLLFAILSVTAFIHVLQKRAIKEEVGKAIWVHSLLVSFACLILNLYWLNYGLIGIRFWAY